MNDLSPFQKQVADALSLLNLECRNAGMVGGIFPVLNIFTEDRRQLSLVLIEIRHWDDSSAITFWPACMQFVGENRDNGLQTIVLWEDFWINKKDIVQSRLAATLGISHKIPARLTKVRRIDKESADLFLSENHLNDAVSSKYKYGLFLPASYFRVLNTALIPSPGPTELLVAVATFSFARIFNKSGNPFRSHELIRFASLSGSNVVGGLDKLLQAFIRDKSPDDVMTYADVEWSAGRSYEKLGFERISQTQPEVIYLHRGTLTRKNRNAVTDELLPDYTEIRNMGSTKYVKTISKPDLTGEENAS